MGTLNALEITLVAGIFCLGLGYGAGRYLQPAKVETKIKEVEVIKHDIKTVTHTVTKPDGSTDTTIVQVDKSTEDKSKESQTTISNAKPNWLISATAGKSEGRDLLTNPTYGLVVQKRFMGPIYLGAYGNNNKEFGLALGMEF